jgi:hypothetical protein
VTVYVQDADFTLHNGDAIDVLRTLDGVDCIVSSPPYLDARPEYGSPTEAWWHEFFALCASRVPGPILLNVGRLFRDGQESDWWMRLLGYAKANGLRHYDTRIWAKPNANPIHGNLFADSHEYVLCLGVAGATFNIDAIRRPHADSTVARFGRGWTNHRGVKQARASRARKTRAEPNPLGALPRSYFECFVGKGKGNPHPAPMAQDVADELVLLASWPGQTVLDPFGGSGTTAIAARKHGRKSVLVDLDETFCALAARRLGQQSLLAEDVA